MLVLFVATVPVGAQAACKSPDFGTFESASWRVGELQTYPEDKYGISFPFYGSNAKGTFYIYDYAIEAPGKSDAEQQLALAVHEIVYFARQEGVEAGLSDPYLVPEIFHANSRLVDQAVYFLVSSGEGHSVTIASMALLNGCFHKVRYTQPVKSTDVDGVSEAFKGFYILIQTMQQALEATNFFK